jgi:hypothetical protein
MPSNEKVLSLANMPRIVAGLGRQCKGPGQTPIPVHRQLVGVAVVLPSLGIAAKTGVAVQLPPQRWYNRHPNGTRVRDRREPNDHPPTGGIG